MRKKVLGKGTEFNEIKDKNFWHIENEVYTNNMLSSEKLFFLQLE